MSLCAVQPVYVQPEDDHYQASKHVAVPYIENTLYSTNTYSCVRRLHTVYISYCLEVFQTPKDLAVAAVLTGIACTAFICYNVTICRHLLF